ncbi:hypothetical protein [Hymenobacter crusticola]|uniref:DUF3806 domain-containing protein n=1 Tax=Hymenobacter crusticola TaxID=1770526 RepID=A0A243WDU8_9BACT|nr:hypothetical protein [Hymenobacter crusticola]OUJ73037.1 hypothetical protein BXP70_14425 [Hymenobacter crusticola]
MAVESPLGTLQNAAETVRQQLRLPAFDAEAVQRLAELIETQRPSLTDSSRENAVTALGCFLGQCLVQTYGGQWAAGPDGTTGVGIGGHSFFNPFYRVAEQLAHGRPSSVAVFFTELPERLAAASGRKEQHS